MSHDHFNLILYFTVEGARSTVEPTDLTYHSHFLILTWLFERKQTPWQCNMEVRCKNVVFSQPHPHMFSKVPALHWYSLWSSPANQTLQSMQMRNCLKLKIKLKRMERRKSSIRNHLYHLKTLKICQKTCLRISHSWPIVKGEKNWYDQLSLVLKSSKSLRSKACPISHKLAYLTVWWNWYTTIQKVRFIKIFFLAFTKQQQLNSLFGKSTV